MLAESNKAYKIKVPRDLSGPAVKTYQAELQELPTRDLTEVVLDCRLLDPATSRHINLLWIARLICDEKNIKLRLTEVSPGLVRVLKVLDLFDLYLPEDKDTTDYMTAGNHSPDSFRSQFTAERESIDKELKEFRQFLNGCSLADALVYELVTIFYEIATNISQHTENTGENLRITFSADLNRTGIRLQFEDDGLAFDPTSHPAVMEPQKAIKDNQIRGFGLAMIARMTEKMRYERRDGRYNTLTIEKLWS